MTTANFVKGKKVTPCDPSLAAALDAVFGEGNNDKDSAANVLSQIWENVAAEAGDFEKVVIETTVTKYIKGEKESFPATIEVLNLNLNAVLAGVVEINRVMEEARAKIAAQKALYKQARSITVHGFEAGKRGRTSSNPYGELLAKYAAK